MDERDKQNLLAGIAAAVIIGLSVWLLHYWVEHRKLQDCYFSGRRNCEAPIAIDR